LKTINKFTWNLWTLPSYLRTNPLDIYHTQYILPFCISRKIKLVTLIHDISFNFYPSLIKWADLLFLKMLIPWSLKRADQVLAVSEFTKREIVNYYRINPEKIAVVPNSGGEDLGEEIYPEELQNIQKKYHLPEKFILYLGTFQPRKNLPVLLKVLVKLKNSGWKLVLAGKRKAYHQDPKIETSIKEFSLEKAVIFAGFIPEEEKTTLFKLAKVFCSAALYEGFNIPLLEALRLGTPVVISDIPPHHEVAGEAAMYFRPQDADDLEAKIREIEKNSSLKEQLIQKGKIQAQLFSWKKTAEKTLEIYQKLGNKF